MELPEALHRLKHIVLKLKDAEIMAPNPVVLEYIIELFEIITNIEEPEMIDEDKFKEIFHGTTKAEA